MAVTEVQVDVREATSSDELGAIADLFMEVWSATEATRPLSSDLLRALSHAGNYVTGAFEGSRLVGASVGFLGRDAKGEIHLHSHITGVTPAAQGRSIGAALKFHQRDWALERGIDRIVWTFDPLIRRNAYFNLVKLGARMVGYHAQFYGEMRDGLNQGDESDRAIISWDLRGAPENAQDEDTVTVWIPEDIVAIRRADPAAALKWRRDLRDTLGGAIRDGYVGVTMSHDGWYTLKRGA